MKTALFVTKDARPGMIAATLAQKLKVLGWQEPAIVAESLSVREWNQVGEIISYGGPEVFDPKNLWKPDVRSILKEEGPDVTIVGLSSPMNLERDFMEAARDSKIPVVAIDDNWDAFARAHVVADLYLTIDPLGQSLIRRRPEYSNAPVYVMGDMAADAPANESTATMIKALQRTIGPVVNLATQKWPESTEILEIGIGSLLESAKKFSFAMVPSIHPGASAEDKGKWWQFLNSHWDKLGGRYFPLHDLPGLKWNNGDALSKLADITVAATGTGVRAAALHGKIPVLVNTPTIASKLKGETGGEPLHPLSRVGAGITLTGVCDLIALVEERRGEILKAQKEYLAPIPFNPKGAAEAIAKLVG